MLKTRIITAIVLIAGFLTALFFATSMVWALLTLAITVIGIWEWSNLIKLSTLQMRVNVALTLIIGFTLVFAENVVPSVLISSVLAYSLIFWGLVAPIWLKTRKKMNSKLGLAILGQLLLLATWLAFIWLRNLNPYWLLGVIATVSIADSAAYFAGKRFGKHKLAPEISPGKTWEGVAGAVVAVTLYGLIVIYNTHFGLLLLVGLWLIVAFSITGDLFESMLKRQAGLKDSSQLLPGHGGVLDRIDGLIPSLPIGLLIVRLMTLTH